MDILSKIHEFFLPKSYVQDEEIEFRSNSTRVGKEYLMQDSSGNCDKNSHFGYVLMFNVVSRFLSCFCALYNKSGVNVRFLVGWVSRVLLSKFYYFHNPNQTAKKNENRGITFMLQRITQVKQKCQEFSFSVV